MNIQKLNFITVCKHITVHFKIYSDFNLKMKFYLFFKQKMIWFKDSTYFCMVHPSCASWIFKTADDVDWVERSGRSNMRRTDVLCKSRQWLIILLTTQVTRFSAIGEHVFRMMFSITVSNLSVIRAKIVTVLTWRLTYKKNTNELRSKLKSI